MTTKPEEPVERFLRCNYRFDVLDKRYHNQSAWLVLPIHETKWNYMYGVNIFNEYGFCTLRLSTALFLQD